MTALRLQLRATPDERLDLSPLTPSRLAGQSPGDIERIAIGTTRTGVRLGDVFRLHPGDASAIEIEGGSERFDCVGAGMQAGRLLLDGDAGVRVGRLMSGGVLEIRGSVGPWAASGLRGGSIEVAGDAGDALGGPMPGERTGMRGGTVVIRGDAGARAGECLRRGLIVVEGGAGRLAAARMVAGTVIVCGRTDGPPGMLMRRGTLVLGEAVRLPLTFVPTDAGVTVFLRLLAGWVRLLSSRAAQILAKPLDRFAGDMAALGCGEVLIGGKD
ncbi:MAG: formylmethanofuran dehydrogenase subunit C [Pseudomonadota bacterium]|nr:formylmethanofuran dehydrogenase subunit C [Pseudomonadota bacterium]